MEQLGMFPFLGQATFEFCNPNKIFKTSRGRDQSKRGHVPSSQVLVNGM